MKKVRMILIAFLLIFSILSIKLYIDTDKPRYLNLTFTRPSGEIEISRIEVTSGISLKGYENTDSITDKQYIEKIINYLNSIPLIIVEEKDFFDDTGGGTIFFYDNAGLCVGWVAVNGKNYIHNSRIVTTFRVYGENLSIIKGLENL